MARHQGERTVSHNPGKFVCNVTHTINDVEFITGHLYQTCEPSSDNVDYVIVRTPEHEDNVTRAIEFRNELLKEFGHIK